METSLVEREERAFIESEHIVTIVKTIAFVICFVTSSWALVEMTRSLSGKTTEVNVMMSFLTDIRLMVEISVVGLSGLLGWRKIRALKKEVAVKERTITSLRKKIKELKKK